MKKLICLVSILITLFLLECSMFIVILVEIFRGCDGEQPKEIVRTENTIIEAGQPEDVAESTNNSTKSGISFGPKLEMRPSINLYTGELEVMPSLHFGPRIDF